MYKIEKNIPISVRTYVSKYNFRKMEVGDSFVVQFEEIKKVRTASCYYGLRNNMKFTTRKIDDTTYRCWRTK